MAQRIVVDPITRIEGHLRIEVEVANGKVTNAWSSAMLFRGLEIILKGRDPRDAWLLTQRACGVCTYVHGLASIRCVDDAVGVTVPDNARLIRNLLMGAQFLHDHIVHFYHLHALDWVDVVSALKADPVKASKIANDVSPAGNSGPSDFKAVQARLQKFVDSGQLGLFANGYWGHPAYKLPPEVNLIAAAHYLEALRQQARTARMHAVFGAKNPHLQSLVVGGVSCAADLNPDRISEFLYLWKETLDFVNNVYLPDVLAVAGFYKDWAGIGGTTNFLAYGEFPQSAKEPESLFLPRGAIFKRNLKKVDGVDPAKISEHVKHSWFEGDKDLNPAKGETKPKFSKLDTAKEYSWMKAPRYNGEPMEVGPLARVLVAYGKGHEPTKKVVDGVLKHLGVPADALFSTLGRTAARAIETQIIAQAMEGWIMQLVENIKKGDAKTFEPYEMPDQAEGMGLNDVPRGALGHWIQIKDKKIANYQLVVPSTWNLGPRCAANKLGPVEEALIGTPVADPKRPVEILRTVHSFDPCIACGVHVIDPNTNEVYKFKVV
ncbi:[NiFe] hydrogenase large subunit [Desulfacinum hydrothermale DSM 13146]|uniref:[NiFe] hydrogenase large subunit n=1 Tax=Desulfacinum hydrothermale DSM 13146 TaxID=1121390 RepID=A0A1W1XTD5_9BACT|nr:nickel-dependent hydrogenase large subunit [Desulfacinum hydrothermale]SMC27223.1 [NiFe] hydrogenase large subunit [Desulfacinum hydrothermale DSM 13146]